MTTVKDLCLEALQKATDRIEADDSLDALAPLDTPEMEIATRMAAATTSCLAMCKALKFDPKQIGAALKNHAAIMAANAFMGNKPPQEWPKDFIERLKRIVEE